MKNRLARILYGHILGRVRCAFYLNGNHNPKYVNQPNKNIYTQIMYVTLKCCVVLFLFLSL